MKDSAKYAKIVEWSVEDQCYIGSAPGLILGGCHGDDEKRSIQRTLRDRRRGDRDLPQRGPDIASANLRTRFRNENAERCVMLTERFEWGRLAAGELQGFHRSV